MKILVVIPARGGSKGIPRKNVRLMNGKPLICYSIENTLNSTYDLDVAVSTDDEEIERITGKYNVKVINRPIELSTDSVTLDPVIHHTILEMEKDNNVRYDHIITMQPTSPLLKTTTLDKAIKYYITSDFDTIISGINKPHLSWADQNGDITPLYEKRLNRQYLPKHIEETGAFVITNRNFVTSKNRLGLNVSIYEITEHEAVDIDTPQDWWVAEKELSKKSILIRTEGYADIGLGHIYRSLLLAYNFIDHDIRFVLSSKSDIGIEKIHNSHFKYDIIENNYDINELIIKYECDILINDVLNTTKSYIENCNKMGVRVVNFEDLGPGANYADVVINDLYGKQNNYENQFWGSNYYCIRDEFLLAEPSDFNETVKEVLIIFGGTDPSDLTYKIFNAIQLLPTNNYHFTFILGMGYKQTEELVYDAEKSGLNIDVVKDVKRMTEYMEKADIAISSQGRTMLELASMTVPTILLAQNEREQKHTFGYLENGFINLGLGSTIKESTIKETLQWLFNSPQIRKQMKNQMMKIDLKNGMSRVKKLILDKNL